MKIHPTAIIDSRAKIHASVEIGPYTIVEENVRIEEATSISSNARIYSGSVIGKNNKIYHGAIIGGIPQHLTFEQKLATEVHIGDNNIIREYCNFHRSINIETPTVIGNNNYFMGNFHLGHDCIIGDDNILAHSTIVSGHVEIGSKTLISGLVAIHQFCRIGDFALVGGASKIVKDVPPYFMADGNPLVLTGINLIGLKRANVAAGRQKSIKNAFKILYKSGKRISDALKELKSLEPSEDIKKLIDFFATSDRGITEYQQF